MNEQLSQGINPLTLSSPGNAYCVPMGARSPSPALRPHHVSNFLFVPQTALLSLYFTIRRLEPIRWMAQWRNEGPRCAGEGGGGAIFLNFWSFYRKTPYLCISLSN